MNTSAEFDPRRIAALEAELQRFKTAAEHAARELERLKRDREQLETQLASVNDVYQKTFELAAVGIAHITLDGRWLRVNQFLCDMLGYTREELREKNFQELTYPPDLALDLGLMQDVVAEKIPSYAMEKRYIRKDGAVIWGHLSVSLVRDRDGVPEYFISIVKNINARVSAMNEVRRNQARLKAVLESLSEGVVVYGTNGELLEINSAARRLFEYETMGEVSKRPDDLDRVLEARTLDGVPIPVAEWPISRLLAGEQVGNAEFQVRRRGSPHFWIGSFSGAIIQDGDGDGASRLAVLTVRDISEQKHAEIALRLSEERLRLAFDNTPDAMVLYDAGLRIQVVNAAAQAMAGAGAHELIGRAEAEFPPFSYMALWRPLLHAALTTAMMQTEDVTYPTDTGLRYLAISCVPLLETKGAVREVLAIAHDYTERRLAEERARYAALHDPLTGLPNRALLFDYAHHAFAGAKRARTRVAVAFIDLDRFKPINDLHGHDVGDTVLRQVAERIVRTIRAEDMLFRLGGDEFLALLTGLNEKDEPTSILQHLLAAIGTPYHVGNLEISLSASIGVSLFPEHGTEIDALISHADAAMYEAKEMGRNDVQTYTPEIAERLHGQLRIEHQIKRALAQRQFCLYYQPLVDIDTGQVVGVEALLRLRGNALSPDCFVPVAEATGLIFRLGEWVFGEACRQHLAWLRDGLPSIPIAVNVSSLQFRNRSFAESVRGAICHHSLHNDAIQIELTETAVMEDIEHATAVLAEFRSQGIKISLDDFGTGYSSLSYLSRLPLDKIKVDKTFIHRLHYDSASKAITESIIALGRALGLKIVAEGIESAQDFEYLRSRGCHQVQGFYVCEPLEGNAFAAWYRSGHAAKDVRH